MTKIGKTLTKIKLAIKRLPSFTTLPISRSNSSNSTSIAPSDIGNAIENPNSNNIEGDDVHAVYVGKSRRRYLVSSETMSHPLFQELILNEKSVLEGNNGRGVVVACEVVFFEHLLWMLENATGSNSHLGSMEELADFYYTC